MRFGLFAIIFLLYSPIAAQAQEKFNQETIGAFYQELMDLQIKGKDTQKLLEFLGRHIHDDAAIVVNIYKQIPGVSAEPETRDFSKAKYIQNTISFHQNTAVESAKHEILSAKIADDGLSTDVKVKMIGYYRLPFEGKDTPTMQEIICDEKLSMTDQYGIQMMSSRCEAKLVLGNAAIPVP